MKARAKYLLDDKPFQSLLEQSLDELDDAQIRFNATVHGLFCLVKDLPKTQDSFGKQLFSVYCRTLMKNVLESAEYRESFYFLGISTSNSLRTKLLNFMNCFEGNIINDINFGFNIKLNFL